MRALVLFLLIANVALYLWVRHENLSDMSDPSLLPPEIGKLRLRNEPAAAQSPAADTTTSDPGAVAEPQAVVTDSPDPAAIGLELPRRGIDEKPLVDQAPAEKEPDPAVSLSLPPPAAAEEIEPVARCARVGPFKPDEADDLIGSLPARYTLLADTSSEQRVATGYYVLVPALASRAAGQEKLRELRDAGFKDVWLFRGGEFRNAISLGLFSNAAGAQRHAQNVARNGFDVEVRDKSSLSQRRWLVLQHRSEDDLKETLPLPRSVKVISQPCP